MKKTVKSLQKKTEKTLRFTNFVSFTKFLNMHKTCVYINGGLGGLGWKIYFTIFLWIGRPVKNNLLKPE
jgi:hypothetical protein